MAPPAPLGGRTGSPAAARSVGPRHPPQLLALSSTFSFGRHPGRLLRALLKAGDGRAARGLQRRGGGCRIRRFWPLGPVPAVAVGESTGVSSPRGSGVEHFLGKEGVTGSNPVVGSMNDSGGSYDNKQ